MISQVDYDATRCLFPTCAPVLSAFGVRCPHRAQEEEKKEKRELGGAQITYLALVPRRTDRAEYDGSW